mgnify:CR=1 FL=1
MIEIRDLQRYDAVKNQYKEAVIINPIMTGGIVPKETQEKLIKEGWLNIGYSICLNCLKGQSNLISKPPVKDFLANVAEFLGGDVAQHTFGCRAAQFAVMKTIGDYVRSKGKKDYVNIVLADSLCHYTTAIAAEVAGLKLVEAPHSGYPEYKITEDSYLQKIEEIKGKTGKLPGLLAVTHVDPYYGNLNPAKEVGKIAEEYEIPYMVNAAYTTGVMPLNMKDLHADFITVSAHKSMASLGPLGFLVTNYEWAKRVFEISRVTTDWSGRTFGNKIPSIFGCSIGGIALISAMYSFRHVVDRVNKWEEELVKTRWFIREMEGLSDVMLLGEHPHNHHLLHFETPIFWEISKRHKRRGFFLAEEMIKRGIVGLHRGLSKHIKLSLYGLGWSDVKRVRDAFFEIAEKYVKEFKLDYSLNTNKNVKDDSE